jgi:Nucleotidyltransferase domain
MRQLPRQVQRLVSRYLRIVDAALPGLVEAMYVAGSAALGDFQPAVSDADFVAVTREPVTGLGHRAGPRPPSS